MFSILPNTVVAANIMSNWVSSPGAVGWSRIKGLESFVITATFCVNASMSSRVIDFLLLLLRLGLPFWGVLNRSAMCIRNLKRFYTAEDASSCVVHDSVTTFATPDEETMSLTYESAKPTKSDLPQKKNAKSVRFLDESGLTGFRSKFGYPPLKDRSV